MLIFTKYNYKSPRFTLCFHCLVKQTLNQKLYLLYIFVNIKIKVQILKKYLLDSKAIHYPAIDMKSTIHKQDYHMSKKNIDDIFRYFHQFHLRCMDWSCYFSCFYVSDKSSSCVETDSVLWCWSQYSVMLLHCCSAAV